MAMNEPVAVAVLAKAPIAGFAKTRLIPVLGADGAARLQASLIERALATACAAGIGPVTLWATPDENHPALQAIGARFPLALARQCDGDLGARMLAALAAAGGPALVIGTDCRALTSEHLGTAADILRRGIDVGRAAGRGRRLCADRHARSPACAVFRHALEHAAGDGGDAAAPQSTRIDVA